MYTTLRAYLTRPNVPLSVHPKVNGAQVRTDGAAQNWSPVDKWGIWADFNIDTIETLFGTLLDTTFKVAKPPPPLNSLRCLQYESHLDFILIRQNSVIVNEALRVACSHLGLRQVEWITGVGNSGDGTFPDWSGIQVSGSNDEESIIPGDTKLTTDVLKPATDKSSSKLDSDDTPVSETNDPETELARSCLQQANYYARSHNARYFYVITNKELFLCRRTADSPHGTPLATRRTKRTTVTDPNTTPNQQIALYQSSSTSITGRDRPTAGTSVSSARSSSVQSTPPWTTGRDRPTAGTTVSPAQPSSGQSTPSWIPGPDRPRAATPILPALSSRVQKSSPPTPSPHPTSDHSSDSTYQPDNTVEDTENLEAVSIRWEAEEGLTVNLGLFVIHLLALVSHEIRPEYHPIDEDPEYCAKFQGFMS
ncbi:hypothetical protein AYO20_09119 [Fonsecaea nubica]|uniref:Uncharacterized protein n=1 Tax=Fonsecaea nubica TaxID=856822 RepID=A0A178CL45_9EURO|nr:hypothetical protein AYO20_09119 [Fonsecaea nubica]OAL29735.1 hypothetical protein AYO20_09119 [Fonsecaea nubica]